jgi:Leucine-rich repeat (LRR) protein
MNLNLESWWNSISTEWQRAFNQVYCNNDALDMVSEELFAIISTTEVVRFVGPEATYPNMNFKLSDLSGLSELYNVKLLIAMNHGIKSIAEIQALTNITALFLNDNEIEDITAVSKFSNLKEFYFPNNLVTSLIPLENLTKLETISCGGNKLNDFTGISLDHEKSITNFYFHPNPNITNRQILEFEYHFGIKVK